MSEPVHGISAVPDERNARYFHVVVHGPGDVSLTKNTSSAKTCFFFVFFFSLLA